MALQDLLNISKERQKQGLSEERVRAIIPVARKYIAFWREYPDIFVDFMAGPNSTFKLYFYQRIFLRAAMRHRYMYATFPRAYSKSFLAIMILMIKCILYPRAHLFVTSGGKEQSAGIIEEKVQEICTLIPAFERELDMRKGKTKYSKDKVQVVFKNESYFDNLAANERTRGKRRHGGVMEECVGIDGTILSEVILPVMNVSRTAMDGQRYAEEMLNKSQLYITTAGWKGTFPYDKLIQLLVWQIVDPQKSCVLGGTYKIPVLAKLLDKHFVDDLKADGTFNEASFDREYNSIWSGTGDNSFFNGEIFDRNRKLAQPEYEYSGRSNKSAYYILSADIGRKGCSTVVTVLKVTPQPHGSPVISLVNMYTYEDVHIEDQVIIFKKLFYKYKAKAFVIDGNGIGINYVDLMVKAQHDPDTGDVLPDFGVINDDENYYKKYQTAQTEHEAMYIIKANAGLNTEAHANVQNWMSSGKIKFLIDEREAKAKLLNTKVGQNMKSEERAKYLKPFTLTSILKEEMLNLREENEGINIILKQANRAIQKDKFSSLEYGLYYIRKLEESKRKRKKKFSAADWMFMN
jgi:hypothetical protein